jgi:hypothetical protein
MQRLSDSPSVVTPPGNTIVACQFRRWPMRIPPNVDHVNSQKLDTT